MANLAPGDDGVPTIQGADNPDQMETDETSNDDNNNTVTNATSEAVGDNEETRNSHPREQGQSIERTPEFQEAQAQPQPASPPLPQKHVAVAPGPRAAGFIKVYSQALRHTLSRVDYKNFAACFPTVALYAPNALRNVQKQMVDYLEERCNTEFQTILDERDVVRKLNELETLVSEADTRRHDQPEDAPEPVPPHTLPPDTVVRAHLHPHLAHQHSQLSAALANTKLENETLFASVKSQREEIEALLATLSGTLADIDGANAMLNEVGPELAAEAREADAEMAGI